MQTFQTVAEDVFIWIVGPKRSVKTNKKTVNPVPPFKLRFKLLLLTYLLTDSRA